LVAAKAKISKAQLRDNETLSEATRIAVFKLPALIREAVLAIGALISNSVVRISSITLRVRGLKYIG